MEGGSAPPRGTSKLHSTDGLIPRRLVEEGPPLPRGTSKLHATGGVVPRRLGGRGSGAAQRHLQAAFHRWTNPDEACGEGSAPPRPQRHLQAAHRG